MPICQNCNKKFPPKVLKDGKELDLRHRKYCLICNPFGERNFWRGKRVSPKTKNGKRIVHEKTFCCLKCGKEYTQKTRNNVCSTCRCKENRNKQRAKALKLKGGKCLICGYNKCPRSLDFHHLDNNKKKFNLSASWEKKWKEIEMELEKCVLLCRNCHGELHEGHFCLIIKEAPVDQRQSQ